MPLPIILFRLLVRNFADEVFEHSLDLLTDQELDAGDQTLHLISGQNVIDKVQVANDYLLGNGDLDIAVRSILLGDAELVGVGDFRDRNRTITIIEQRVDDIASCIDLNSFTASNIDNHNIVLLFKIVVVCCT